MYEACTNAVYVGCVGRPLSIRMAAVVVDVERIVCEVPFTERQARITEREVYTWNVVELCKVTLSTGEVGWGETVL